MYGMLSLDGIGSHRTPLVNNLFDRLIQSRQISQKGLEDIQKKTKQNFYRISFGSIKESLDWNEKARARKLLLKEHYEHILQELNYMPREINNLIRFTNEKLSK